jgi:hypothetical protein
MAARTPFKCTSTMSSGIAQAPPWTSNTGSIAKKVSPKENDGIV